ncbi:MAG: uroporphyrinogen decarboxylase family protein [Bacteroidales bacterium]|nr:uroporphyrinogen decarboxylase family protein [Bacteroidales bacterium]
MKTLLKNVQESYREGRRLVCPLIGFPGLQMTNSTIKLAQQNYGEHYKVLRALVEKYQPDLVFPLMDLSVEANALGAYTIFPKEDSATVLKDGFSADDLEKHSRINIASDTRLLGYVETVRLANISFPEQIVKGAYVTGPFSLIGLLMGAEEAAIAAIMDPDTLLRLCEFAVERILEYIRLLIGAGAQVICVLEPTAVMLGPEEFERFSAAFIRHIVSSYKYTGVSIVYHTCGNTMHLIEQMVGAQVDALSLDSPEVGVALPEVAKRIRGNTILMGNINPTGAILTGKPEDVHAEVTGLLRSMDDCENFVLSTGCDLPQEVPVENIQAFMDAGRSYRIGKG